MSFDVSALEAQILAQAKKVNELKELAESRKDKYKGFEEKLRSLDEEEQEFIRKMVEKRRKAQEERSKMYNLMRATDMELSQMQGNLKHLQKKLDDEKAKASSQDKLAELANLLGEQFGDRKWWKMATDYQREDIVYFCSAFLSGKNGVLNANVMGSGKTLEQAGNIEVLRWLFARRFGHLNRLPRILWLTKKSLLGSSHAELNKWAHEDINFLYITGNPAEREAKINLGLAVNAVIMANYDMLNTTPRLMDVEWDFVFIDEVHQLKGGANPSGATARFLNTKKLLGIVEHNKWKHSRTRMTLTDDGEETDQLPFLSMLSATPVQNRPEEVWCYLHLFEPEVFPSVNTFMSNFVDFYGGFQPQKLLETLPGRFIRQDPQLIYRSRPDKDRMVVEVEMEPKQRKAFEMALQMVLEGFDDAPNERVNITALIAQLTRCRQITLWPPMVNTEAGRLSVYESGKVEACMEIIEQLRSDGEQVVVWTAQFNGVLDVIAERCRMDGMSVAFITGATQEPNKVEEAFQQGKVDVLLCNMKAAGEGYNFNKNPELWPGGASNAIFLDQWYNPQVNLQAEDRIWRTGAVEGVKIWILHDPDSIDAFIKELCDSKEQMFNDLIEQEKLQPSKHDWKNMLTDILNKD